MRHIQNEGGMIMPKYIYAEDPTIKKRVVHVIKGGWAISIITGHKFKYEEV
jgi:hypothetical protein